LPACACARPATRAKPTAGTQWRMVLRVVISTPVRCWISVRPGTSFARH